MLKIMKDLRRAQQRLGRNAAPVQADAAQIVALDDGGLESELRRADGADITARAGADDDDVEVRVGHVLLHQHHHGIFDQRLERADQPAPSAPSTAR